MNANWADRYTTDGCIPLRGNVKIMFTYYIFNRMTITIYQIYITVSRFSFNVGALVDINVPFVIRLDQKGLLQRVTLRTNC
jgi:hypothetical protein